MECLRVMHGTKAARHALQGLYQPGKALSIPRREIINFQHQDNHTREIS